MAELGGWTGFLVFAESFHQDWKNPNTRLVLPSPTSAEILDKGGSRGGQQAVCLRPALPPYWPCDLGEVAELPWASISSVKRGPMPLFSWVLSALNG